MALLGSKEKVHELTRFYQLNTDTGERWGELVAWLKQEANVTQPPKTPDEISDMDRLAGIHKLVRRIMDDLAAGNQLREGDVDCMTAFANEIRTFLQIAYRRPGEGPLDWLHRRPEDTSSEPDRRIHPRRINYATAGAQGYDQGKAADMLMGLAALCHHAPTSFRRCAECDNVFFLSREGQTYCSRRCAARVGTRRRRAEQKRTGAYNQEAVAMNR